MKPVEPSSPLSATRLALQAIRSRAVRHSLLDSFESMLAGHSEFTGISAPTFMGWKLAVIILRTPMLIGAIDYSNESTTQAAFC